MSSLLICKTCYSDKTSSMMCGNHILVPLHPAPASTVVDSSPAAESTTPAPRAAKYVPPPVATHSTRDVEVAEIVQNMHVYPQRPSEFPWVKYSHGYNVYPSNFQVPLTDLPMIAARVEDGDVEGFAYAAMKTKMFPTDWKTFCPKLQPIQRVLLQQEKESMDATYSADIVENCSVYPQTPSTLEGVKYYCNMNIYPRDFKFDIDTAPDMCVGKLNLCAEKGKPKLGAVSVYMYIPRNLREKFNLFVPGTVYEKKLELTGLSFGNKKEEIDLAEIMRLSWPVEKSPNFDDVALRKTIDIGLGYLYKSKKRQ